MPHRWRVMAPAATSLGRSKEKLGNADGVKFDEAMPVPERMSAWVLGDPDALELVEKPVPMPGRAEALVRIDAVAICATDLEIDGERLRVVSSVSFLTMKLAAFKDRGKGDYF